jgi:anti-sigma factor RsiW
MSCQSVDLKAYVLAELPAAERKRVEDHAGGCVACREELERLDATHASLLLLREEEIPRRIGFVSDKVFEPSWWQRLWQSGPRLGFASAAMLSVAILAHGFVARQAAAPAPSVNEAQIAARIDTEVAERVSKALAVSEERQTQVTVQTVEKVLAEERKKFDLQRQMDLVSVQENFDLLRKQISRGMYLASRERGDPQ